MLFSIPYIEACKPPLPVRGTDVIEAIHSACKVIDAEGAADETVCEGLDFTKASQHYDFSRPASFFMCSLRSGRFSEMQLTAVDFSCADVRAANFANANLSYANLSMTDCRGACFEGAELLHTNMRGADLRGAELTNARFGNTNLTEAKLGGCCYMGGVLRDKGAVLQISGIPLLQLFTQNEELALSQARAAVTGDTGLTVFFFEDGEEPFVIIDALSGLSTVGFSLSKLFNKDTEDPFLSALRSLCYAYWKK